MVLIVISLLFVYFLVPEEKLKTSFTNIKISPINTIIKWFNNTVKWFKRKFRKKSFSTTKPSGSVSTNMNFSSGIEPFYEPKIYSRQNKKNIVSEVDWLQEAYNDVIQRNTTYCDPDSGEFKSAISGAFNDGFLSCWGFIKSKLK